MTTPGTPVSLGNGVAVTDRFLIIVGFPDETSGQDIPVTRLFYLNLDSPTPFTFQEWIGETVVSACLRKARGEVRRAGCFLSEEGRVEILNSSEHHSEMIDPNDDAYGSFRSIQEVGRSLYACGYGGQLYSRDDHGWRAIDGGLHEQSRAALNKQLGLGGFGSQGAADFGEQIRLAEQTPNFNRVDGADESDVYVCGLNGIIGYHNGSTLKILESPTEVHLLDIHCVSKDRIIMSGYHETLLVGSAQTGFEIIHQSDKNINLYSVRQFQGELYAGTTSGLRRLRGNKFEVVIDAEAKLNEATVIQQIDSVDDDWLWIISDRHIYRYDGARAERIPHPDNET